MSTKRMPLSARLLARWASEKTLKQIRALESQLQEASEASATLRVERADALADREDMRRTLKRLTQERDAAVDCYDHVKAERDEARANYQWMVNRAADEKLEGYRELGARAAQAENARDAAQARVRELEGKLSQAVAHGMDWGKARIAQLEAEGGAIREKALMECARQLARNFCERCAYENNQWLRAALAGDGG